VLAGMNGRLAGRLSVARVRAAFAALRTELPLAMPRISFVSGRRHCVAAKSGTSLVCFCRQAFLVDFAATAQSDATVVRK